MFSSTYLLNYFRQHNRGFALSLIVVASLIYLPFLGNQLFFDDIDFLSGGIVSHLANRSFHFEPRWLHYASLTWTWIYFSDIPPIYRLFNALIHTATALLLFFWLRQIVFLASSDIKTSYLTWGAWLGALFFACNPVAVYAVGYIVQRSILLATLFTLAMQLAYLRGLIAEQKITQKLWMALSVLLYFLAISSKEHGLTAPAIIVATTFLLHSHVRVDKKTLWTTWLSYLVIGLLLALQVKGVLGSIYEIDAPVLIEQQQLEIGSPQNLQLLSMLTQAGLFFKYLLLWWFPNPAWMSVDMRETFVRSVSAWQNWVPAICFILYGLIAFKMLLRRGWLGLIGLALLYPWLFFLIEFSTIRVQEPFVLYRSYLWLPGMTLIFPVLINAFSSRKTVIALTIIILSFVPLSWNRLWVFSDQFRLWNDAALLLPDEHAPGAARIYYNRGIAGLEHNRWEDSAADLRRVISINPKIAQAHNSLGTAYTGLGNYQQAISEFDQAITLKPDYANAYYGKGIAQMHLHLNKEAAASMKKGCELKNTAACIITAFSGAWK